MSTDLFANQPTPPGGKSTLKRALQIGGGVVVLAALIGGGVFGLRALDARDQAATDAAHAANDPVDGLDFSGLTRAITAHDQSKALSYVTGSAVPLMTRWLSNMETIGYTIGGVEAVARHTFKGSQQISCEAFVTSCDVTIRMGTAKPGALTFAAKVAGAPEATLTTSSTYQAHLTLTPGSGHGYVIDSLTSLDQAPWDTTELETVRGDGVLLVGPKGTTSDLTAARSAAEKAARNFTAIFGTDTPANLTGGVLHEQMLFLAPDQGTYSSWFQSKLGIINETAGLTFSRPSLSYGQALVGTKYANTAIPATAATGSVVTIAPLARLREASDAAGLSFEDVLADTVLHEWTHSYYFYFVPADLILTGSADVNTCTVEGLARYVETVAAQGNDWKAAKVGDLLRRSTISFRDLDASRSDFFTGDLRAVDGRYNGCASAYYFTAEQGNNPFEAAKKAYLSEQESIAPVLPHGAADIPAWQAWARSHAG